MSDAEDSPSSSRVFYVTIPAYAKLTPEQREVVESGGPYPVIESDYLPHHEVFATALVDWSLDAWTRSRD